jgi:hypothetical protein
MRQRNYKIILTVTLGFLLSFSAASAKNFSIFNATTPSQSYFTVNGTSGNVGIGITNPTSLLQILNNGWLSAQNAAGTGVVNMFKVNANDQIEVGAPLNIGSFEFSPDSGLVSFVDMPVTSAATAGTPEGYAFKVDGDNIMTAYSESNGTGGIQNKRLGIGLTNPTVALDVSGALRNTLATTHSLLGGAGNVLVMSDNSGNLYATSTAGFLGGGSDLWGGTTTGKIWNANYGHNIGMGTTNPFRKLDINQGIDGTQLQVRNNSADTLSQSAGIQFSLADSGVTTDEYAKGAIFLKGDGSDWGRGDFIFALDNAADAGNASTSDAKMVIRKDGNVGIGTTSPIASLDIMGSTTTGAALLNIGGNDLSGDVMRVTSTGPSGTTYTAGSSAVLNVAGRGTTPSVRTRGGAIFSETYGNVGIGTTNPLSKLQVGAGTDAAQSYTALLVSNATDTAITIRDSVADVEAEFSVWQGKAYVGTKTNHPLRFFTNDGNGDQLFLATSTNVGVGNTYPGTKLDVSGSFRNSLATTHSLLGGAGNVVVMADNTGALYATSTASLMSGGTNFWGGTKNANIWNGDAGVGNVGIGTTSPGGKLTVAQNMTDYTYPFTGPHIKLLANNAVDSTGFVGITYAASSAINYGWSVGANRTAGGESNFVWKYHSNDATGTERMRISATGNVGIGVTNPVAKLDIQGVYNQQGFKMANDRDDGGINFQFYDPDNVNGGVVFRGNSNNSMNVGFGTTTPSSTLDIYTESNSQPSLTVSGQRDGNAILFNVFDRDEPNGGLVVTDHNGATNVGIGTTTPSAKLTVHSKNADGSQIFKVYDQSDNTDVFTVEDLNGSAPGVIIKQTSNVGIAITNPTVRLDVGGTFRNTLATTHSLLGGAGNVVVMADNTGALYATSTAGFSGGTNFWGGTKNGTIWNGDAGAGNVGIGTTNPAFNLQVYGSGANYNDGNIAVNPYGQSYPGIMGRFQESNNTALGESYFTYLANGMYHINGAAENRYSVYNQYVNGQAITLNSEGFKFVYADSIADGNQTVTSTELMTLRSNGNLGIGTTNPGYKLEISSSDGSAQVKISNTSTGYAPASILLNGQQSSSRGQGIYYYNTESDTSWFSGVPYAVAGANWMIGYQSAATWDPAVAQASTSLFMVKNDGNVGIGTTNPTTKLYVAGTALNTLATTHSLLGGAGEVLVMADASGNLYATSTAGFIGGSGSYLPLTGGSLSGNLNMGGNNILNINKLTVNTIDPLYNIQGTNYSTFAASIAGGVKEEYIGRVKINKLSADGEREYVVDFDNLAIGSDLWVWRKTVDFSADNVEVIATPYGSFAQVYYKIEDNKIIFRADRPTTISYRLSGRRVDWRKWPTKALDQTEKAGFVIE